MRYVHATRTFVTELQEAFEKNPALASASRQKIRTSAGRVLHRAQQAGVARDDVDEADLVQLVAGMCLARNATSAQNERLLVVVLDGIRKRRAPAGVPDPGCGPGSRSPGRCGPGSRSPGRCGPGSRSPGRCGPGSRSPGRCDPRQRSPCSSTRRGPRPGSSWSATTYGATDGDAPASFTRRCGRRVGTQWAPDACRWRLQRACRRSGRLSVDTPLSTFHRHLSSGERARTRARDQQRADRQVRVVLSASGT